MNKLLLQILIFLGTLNFLRGQERIAYHDAGYLKAVINANGGKFQISTETRTVLNSYFDNPPDDISLALAIKSNPFLKDYYQDAVAGFTFNPLTAPNILPSIGALDVTKFADGLAKFIVERSKKELQVAFFDKFAVALKDDNYKDIQTLFPMTFGVIKLLPEDIYDYQPYIQSLREAFGKDLQNILPAIENVLKNGKYKEVFDNHKELKAVCLTALHFAKGIQRGEHIGIVLESYNTLDKQYEFSDVDNLNITKNNAFLFIQQVSKSLKTNFYGDTKEYYITSSAIRALPNDQLLFKIYIGLLYERVKNLPVAPNQLLTYGQILIQATTINGKFSRFIDDLAYQIENIQSQRENIEKNKLANKTTIDDYISYFNTTINLLDFFKESDLLREIIEKVPPLIKPDIEKFWTQYDNFITASNSLLNIYTNLKEKNYSIVISNVRNLYEIRYNANLESIDPTDKKKINQVTSFLLEKGAFIAGVAEAENSNEVYEAINKVAMPTGSARVKRLSKTNVALNAYCGLFAGIEKIYGVKEQEKGINTYGLAAPVGISFSKGNSVLPFPFHTLIKTKGWSSTILLSIIDIGAIASYRFNDDIAEQVPTIQLKDIFSPGLFYSIGIAKTPISINLGAQVGPNLREVTATENDYSKNTYIRYSAAICIDIPIINLFTESN